MELLWNPVLVPWFVLAFAQCNIEMISGLLSLGMLLRSIHVHSQLGGHLNCFSLGLLFFSLI